MWTVCGCFVTLAVHQLRPGRVRRSCLPSLDVSSLLVMEGPAALFEALVLCSIGERVRGEAILRVGQLQDTPLPVLVRQALLASTSQWSTPMAVKKGAGRLSGALRWSAEQLVADELLPEWAAVLTTCAALLSEPDSTVKRDALLTVAHTLSQRDAHRHIANWHSGACPDECACAFA